jgi:hypothetical protein
MKSQTRKIKALCYFDNDKGRDVEILMPVLYYAETYLNVEVEKAFIFDIDKIRRKKPDLVIIANTIGSRNHHLIAKYAYENGIKVFALMSEGNSAINGTYLYYGYNTDKRFYQEYICKWSERTRDFLKNELPEIKDRIVLTGATGFDRYKVYKFESKEVFLKRYGLEKYKKVIGYAGWSFGKLYHEIGLREIRNFNKSEAENRINWMREQQPLIENILQEAIENNPDTLFILKRHPNEIHPHLTQKDNNEMVNLEHYPNVLYLTNEEDVHTLINISDIWTAFESTTVLETWIMKEIPTIFINPDTNFRRDNNYKGTVIVNSYNDFQEKINEFYNTGKVLEMFNSEKIQARQEIVHNVIGFADGLNHVRAGYYLAKTVKKIDLQKKNKIKLSLYYLIRYILLNIGSVFYYKQLFLLLPKFKKTVWVLDRFKLPNIEKLKKEYYSYLDEFHTNNSLKDKINNSDYFNKFIK